MSLPVQCQCRIRWSMMRATVVNMPSPACCLPIIIWSLSSPLISQGWFLRKLGGENSELLRWAASWKPPYKLGLNYLTSSKVLYLETSLSSSQKQRDNSSWDNIDIEIYMERSASHLLACVLNTFRSRDHLTKNKKTELRVSSMSKTVHNFLRVVRKKVISF